MFCHAESIEPSRVGDSNKALGKSKPQSGGATQARRKTPKRATMSECGTTSMAATTSAILVLGASRSLSHFGDAEGAMYDVVEKG